MAEITLTQYQVWQQPVGDSQLCPELLLSTTYCKADAEEDRYLTDKDEPAPDKDDFRRIVIREVQITLTIENYRAGLDRNEPTALSHTYAMMSDGELWPMCGYGWNRSNGERFSILRQVPGSRGKCKLCARNIAAGKPPVIDGFKHETKWL